MPKSLQFALAAGSMFIFASATMAQDVMAQEVVAQDVMAQDVTARLSPLFQVQPQSAQAIAQKYAPYSIPPSMIWRAPVFPHIWDAQPAVPFAMEETSAPDRASKP